jgi:hypothetical protein
MLQPCLRGDARAYAQCRSTVLLHALPRIQPTVGVVGEYCRVYAEPLGEGPPQHDP